MEILHIAVPAAILLVAFAIAVFWWAVKHGQFDDLERQGMNILLDEEPTKPKAAKKQPQTSDSTTPENPSGETIEQPAATRQTRSSDTSSNAKS